MSRASIVHHGIVPGLSDDRRFHFFYSWVLIGNILFAVDCCNELWKTKF